MEASEVEMDEDFQLYSAQDLCGKCHTLLKVPRNLPSRVKIDDVAAGAHMHSIFNIVMADCSGSMSGVWAYVVRGWQKHIKENLKGLTKMYIFDTKVHFLREGTELTEADFSGGGTNITAALKTLRSEVESCEHRYVRVFIITDGGHGAGEPFPETEILKMIPPQGKTISVYLLGIGNYFPVNYSIDIRSHLHNGNANVPSMYWAKEYEDAVTQLGCISDDLNSALMTLELNTEMFVLPNLDKMSTFYLGEWLYFEGHPDDITTLQFKVNEGEFQSIPKSWKPVTAKHLLEEVFRQWNSILIQQHRKKARVPHETFDLMESLFAYQINEMKAAVPQGNDVKTRLNKKHIVSYESEFRALKNRGQNLICIEDKFSNELELADTILKTTITKTKYDTKNLKLKGHGIEEYEEDVKAFKKIYESKKKDILALPAPLPEECCSVTISSTLSDLQDPNFHLLLLENKFELEKSFSISGIPIYAPIHDSSQINPWTLRIKNVLVTPYSILSQQVLEMSGSVDENSVGSSDGDIILQQDNEKTRFNAIVPIVPSRAIGVLKPLILSNIYAMMATFAILKNPHIIDYNAHIAALGCVWLKTVVQFPLSNRPEFAKDRLKNVVATSSVYMGRPSIKCYVDALFEKPKQALMTESTEEFGGKTLKCESLIKPVFFIYLCKDKFSSQQIINLLKLMLYEFLGRCISSIRPSEEKESGSHSPFTYFFCEDLADAEKRKQCLEKHCKITIDGFQGSQGNLLQKFFTIEDLLPSLKKYVHEQVGVVAGRLMSGINIAPNFRKITKLRNFASCGDISWQSFKSWAEEMGLTKEMMDDLFSAKQVAIYLYEALHTSSSRDRQAKDLPEIDTSYDTIMQAVTEKVDQENQRTLRSMILKAVEDYAVKKWREEYMIVHQPLIMPMTPVEIVTAAQAKDIPVTLESFTTIYRYNDRLGILRNACQIPGCPHYLQPHNNYNQHLYIEREQEDFPHSLHLVSHEFHRLGLDGVLQEVTSGNHGGTNARKRPPPPSPGALQPLTEEIKTLLTIYSEK